jgi:dolichol-phosphate mannosyltransferase
MAPSIVIGEQDYLHLRRREKEIMASAIRDVRVRAVASNDFTWADTIAGLLPGQTPGDDQHREHRDGVASVVGS